MVQTMTPYGREALVGLVSGRLEAEAAVVEKAVRGKAQVGLVALGAKRLLPGAGLVAAVTPPVGPVIVTRKAAVTEAEAEAEVHRMAVREVREVAQAAVAAGLEIIIVPMLPGSVLVVSVESGPGRRSDD